MKRIALMLAAVFLCAPLVTQAQTAPFSVNGSIALSSFQSLVDGHLKTMADSLETLASTGDAMSLNWARINPALQRAGQVNVPAVMWYAKPDGTYFTTLHGREPNNMAQREFFARAMGGRVAVGQMVVSKSTRREVAIIAVPIFNRAGAVTGLLGGSVYLDELSNLIRSEMGLAPNDVFYTTDNTGTIGLNWDRTLIMKQTRTAWPELAPMVDRMHGTTQGVETYAFRGRTRTIIYKKSAFTGWWYALGTVR